MRKTVSSEFLFTHRSSLTFIDVRSPFEYEKGHIPQAINLPLFSNEVRKIVGS